MITLKIRKIGSSAGVILPKEALNRLGVKEGDSLFLVKSARGYEVALYDSEFAKQVEIAEEGIRAYRNTFRELEQ